MNNMDNSTIRLIDKALDRYLPAADMPPTVLHSAMRYSVLSGGKRIRPVIVIESAKACGGKLKDALAAGCAIEIIHTYSLIHDDLPSMDDDDYRRGRPSCHKKFGEANAILAGDALLTLAFNILADELTAQHAARAIVKLSDAIGTLGMAGGQALDLEFKNRKAGKKDLDKINSLKTAKLFEVSAFLGAITAGAASKKEAAMARYGYSLGMAFQITDDILDKDGYFKLLGPARSIEKAAAFVKKAEDALRIFGPEADGLRKIVNEIGRRNIP